MALLWFTVQVAVDPGLEEGQSFNGEVPLDKIIRCQSDGAVNSQLSISTKRQAPLALLDKIEDNFFVSVYRDHKSKKQHDIKVDLGQLFGRGNAQVCREHRD